MPPEQAAIQFCSVSIDSTTPEGDHQAAGDSVLRGAASVQAGIVRQLHLITRLDLASHSGASKSYARNPTAKFVDAMCFCETYI